VVHAGTPNEGFDPDLPFCERHAVEDWFLRTVILALFDHMYWANHRLLEAAALLPLQRFLAPSELTTRGLRATLVHELDVEWSWRLNVQGRPLAESGPDAELRPEDYPNAEALRDHWRRDEREMRAWLGALTDEDLERPTSSAFTNDTRPLWQYLLHIVTHAGQQQADAATLLTIEGLSPGEIDFGAFLQSEPTPA
jgi:uncharacterized damage-inducible protein DinB